MSYDWLKQQEAQRLDALVELGELTPDEATKALQEWEYSYGDFMYDLYKDRDLD